MTFPALLSPRFARAAAPVLALVMLLTPTAAADVVVLTNGDRISGTIVNAVDGKLTIKTDLAGEIVLPLASVSTLQSDNPVRIHLSDGSILDERVRPGDTGNITIGGGGDPLLEQAIALGNITAINPPPKDTGWRGQIKAGALITTGNTRTRQVNVAASASRRRADDRIELDAEYLFGRQTGENGVPQTTTDNWTVRGKYDYFFSEKLYAFALTKVQRDRVAELDLRLAPSAGLGYQWIEQPTANFSTELGAGWVYEDYENADNNDYASLRLAYRYDRKLNDRVALVHTLEYLPSLESFGDFLLTTDAAVRVDLTTRLFAEFKLEWRYDSEPAPGSARNDLRYVANLGWTFGG